MSAQDLDSLQIEQSILSSIGNPAALDSLEKAYSAAVKGDFNLENVFYYNLAKARFMGGELDKAFELSEEGISLCNAKKTKRSSAKFYNLQASVYAYKKDNETSIKTFKTSLSILEEAGDSYTAAQIQNNIANIFLGLLDYKSAYKYSKLSYDTLKVYNDSIHLPAVASILAVSALRLDKMEEGKRLAKEGFQLSTKYKNPLGLIVSNYGMGEVSNSSKQVDEAIGYFSESLRLSQMYRQSHFVMLNKIALQSAMYGKGENEKSIDFGLKALEETSQLENENTLYAIKKNLGYAYGALGKSKEAFEYLSSAHEIYTESSGVENQKVINELLIQYETEKKERDLIASKLKNLEDQEKLRKSTRWIVVLCALLLIALLGYVFYRRIQKQKLVNLKKEQEAKRLLAAVAAEEAERERLSNELHDGMASSITGIKMKLEDISQDDDNAQLTPLVAQLEKLHDETRRMSHNLMPLGLNEHNWLDRLKVYCRENSSTQFNIQLIDNTNSQIQLDPSISILIYRSIQELVHNVIKHAQTKACTIQLSKLNQDLVFSVEDEGQGFDISSSKGQGIASMKQRLSEIGANLDIESQVGRGTMVTISIPIS